MENFLLTMVVAIIVGYIFLKLKVPGAMMVGSIIAVSLLNISTGLAYMPSISKTLAQIIAGSFIAIGLEKSDLKRLRHIYKPAIVLLGGMLILNIVLGFIIHYTSHLDLVTSLMSTIPGGISEVPIISEEMGADSSTVAVMQFTRLIFGVGLFPLIISKVSERSRLKDGEAEEVYKRSVTHNDSIPNLILTIMVASTFGLLGKKTGIPSATLVFSMISTMVFKLTTNKGSMPRWMRWIAQLLSGAYIGSSIGMNEVSQMRYLIWPGFLLVSGYLVACFLIGNVLHRRYNMSLAEAMLAATPAGASDMALISADIGIESADVVVLQIIRMVTVISVFPQVLMLIIEVLG